MTGMYITRQDHIDPQVSKIDRCPTSWNQRDMVVTFTNGSWVCSSGHHSLEDLAPTLRTPDRDPVMWVRANAKKVVDSLSIMKCPTHEDELYPRIGAPSWGETGHLWGSGPSGRVLALCLPRGDLHV